MTAASLFGGTIRRSAAVSQTSRSHLAGNGRVEQAGAAECLAMAAAGFQHSRALLADTVEFYFMPWAGPRSGGQTAPHDIRRKALPSRQPHR